MPITPLHYGVLAPINWFLPGKVSLISFTIVNLWIDIDAILAVLTGEPTPDHGLYHSFVGAMVIAVMVTIPGMRSMKWALGAYIAAISHVLLDGLVHPEMHPFYPMEGNPLYMGLMAPLSLVLVPFTIWFIVQFVSFAHRYVRGCRSCPFL